MAGPRLTEVRLGWMDGGLGQRRNDGGGCSSIRERSERVESNGKYVTESVSVTFLIGPVFFGPPSRAMVVIT